VAIKIIGSQRLAGRAGCSLVLKTPANPEIEEKCYTLQQFATHFAVLEMFTNPAVCIASYFK
jgi:hypothetical protein